MDERRGHDAFAAPIEQPDRHRGRVTRSGAGPLESAHVGTTPSSASRSLSHALGLRRNFGGELIPFQFSFGRDVLAGFDDLARLDGNRAARAATGSVTLDGVRLCVLPLGVLAERGLEAVTR